MNLAIHVLAGLTLLGIPGARLRRRGPIGRTCSIVCCVDVDPSPLQTESVTTSIQRPSRSLGLFYLLRCIASSAA